MSALEESWDSMLSKEEKAPMTPQQTVNAHEKKFQEERMNHNATIANPSLRQLTQQLLPVLTESHDSLSDILNRAGTALLAPNHKRITGPVDKAINSLRQAIQMANAHTSNSLGEGFDLEGGNDSNPLLEPEDSGLGYSPEVQRSATGPPERPFSA